MHKGGLLTLYYRIKHPGVPYEQIPYYYKRSIFSQVTHLLKKWICQVWAPNSTINFVRVNLYRLCGFKIGKGTFIGMKCYLDDLCADRITIGRNVVISYGVYFACHSPFQHHNRLVIEDGVYVGMRACIIAPNDLTISENAVVGAMTLVNKSIPANTTAVGVPCRLITKQSSKVHL